MKRSNYDTGEAVRILEISIKERMGDIKYEIKGTSLWCELPKDFDVLFNELEIIISLK